MKNIEGVLLGSLIGVIALGLWLSLSPAVSPATTLASAAVSSAPMTRTVMLGGEVGIMPMTRLIDPQTGVVCYSSGNSFACATIDHKLAVELSKLK